jgi:5'-3' exonuclease
MESIQLLIDADSMYFRTCMVTQKQNEVRKGIKNSIKEIKDNCAPEIFDIETGYVKREVDLRIAVKGANNFRYDVYDLYKGNRKRDLEEAIKKCLGYAHDHLIQEHGAIRCDGMEADDMVAIWAWECILSEMPYVVVHIDKDLDMIPGTHYNFVKQETYTVDFDTAHYNFIKQILTGDNADNIPGVKGIGPKKAEKLLEGVPFEQRYTKVKEAWNGNLEDMHRSARLLWMSTTFEEAEGANEAIIKRLEAKTLDEFWLGIQEEQDETPPASEASECEQDVREEGEDNLQDEGVSGVSGEHT